MANSLRLLARSRELRGDGEFEAPIADESCVGVDPSSESSGSDSRPPGERGCCWEGDRGG